MNILTHFADYPQFGNHLDRMYGPSRDYSDNIHLSPETMLGLLLFGLVFAILVYALYAWLLGRIFAKAGLAKSKAWIPVYRTWKLLELGGQPGFWSILMLIPFVNYVAVIFLFIAQYNVGLKLGKESWWVVLAIFVPIIWLALLAFDSSTWLHEPVVKRVKAPKEV